MLSSFKDIGIAVLISLALYASGLLVIFTPLPLMYVFVVRGRKMGILTAAIAAAIVAAFYVAVLPAIGAASPESLLRLPLPAIGMSGFVSGSFIETVGVGYFVFFVLIALVLSEGVYRKWSLGRWGGNTLIAGLVAIAALIIAIYYIGGANVLDGFKVYLTRILSEVASVNQSTGSQTAEISFIRDHAAEIISFMLSVAPALIFVFVLIVVAANFVLGRRVIRSHHAFAHVHNIARFKLPDFIVWAVIVSGAMFFVNRYVVKLGWAETVAFNGFISLGALYFFQGLAVVVYFLQGIKMPFFRTIAYLAIIFFFQTLGMMIVAIGVADVWANFRLRSWRARHSHEA